MPRISDLSTPNSNQFRSLKIALIADDLTSACIKKECQTMNVTPLNCSYVLNLWKPDILFVESAWRGHRDSWRYKIASYAGHQYRNNDRLARVVNAARRLSIPAVFWNREDGIHFDRFIKSAQLFDAVLTVDIEMLPHYRRILGDRAKIGVMLFAASTALHAPKPTNFIRRGSFVGSYSAEHRARKTWQDEMFVAASKIGLTVYDRNSSRKAEGYRFPSYDWIHTNPRITHCETAEVYRRHAVNLNVNTITNSSTAFSRRLVEIISTGSLAFTNVTPAVSKLFDQYCIASNDPDEAKSLFERISHDGLSLKQIESVRAGADFILKEHTWQKRLEQIVDFVT